MALSVAKEMEQLNVCWLEEPLPHHLFENMAKLRQMSPVRIAGGEMNRRWHDFREMERAGSLDVYQPDVALCGGITQVKKIGELVQGSGAWFSPHTWSNGIGLLANLHLAAAISECPYLEYPYDPPNWSVDRRDYVQSAKLTVDSDGYLHVPQRPGWVSSWTKRRFNATKSKLRTLVRTFNFRVGYSSSICYHYITYCCWNVILAGLSGVLRSSYKPDYFDFEVSYETRAI